MEPVLHATPLQCLIVLDAKPLLSAWNVTMDWLFRRQINACALPLINIKIPMAFAGHALIFMELIAKLAVKRNVSLVRMAILLKMELVQK